MVDVPAVLVKPTLDVELAKFKVLPAAPRLPLVPMTKERPALTVVPPAKPLLLPVSVKVPAPACVRLPAPVNTEAFD